jgi:hypothetical protein
MAVNRLENGNPLTFNWLNMLADAVANHEKSLSKMSGNQKISIVPGHVTTGTSSGNIQILTGQASVSFNAANPTDAEVTVNFQTGFASSAVVVFPSINFKGPGIGDFNASCTVTNVGKSSCKIKIHRFPPISSSQKTATATIAYLAIGPGR